MTVKNPLPPQRIHHPESADGLIWTARRFGTGQVNAHRVIDPRFDDGRSPLDPFLRLVLVTHDPCEMVYLPGEIVLLNPRTATPEQNIEVRLGGSLSTEFLHDLRHLRLVEHLRGRIREGSR